MALTSFKQFQIALHRQLDQLKIAQNSVQSTRKVAWLAGVWPGLCCTLHTLQRPTTGVSFQHSSVSDAVCQFCRVNVCTQHQVAPHSILALVSTIGGTVQCLMLSQYLNLALVSPSQQQHYLAPVCSSYQQPWPDPGQGEIMAVHQVAASVIFLSDHWLLVAAT